jgi:hypothetical protein
MWNMTQPLDAQRTDSPTEMEQISQRQTAKQERIHGTLLGRRFG